MILMVTRIIKQGVDKSRFSGYLLRFMYWDIFGIMIIRCFFLNFYFWLLQRKEPDGTSLGLLLWELFWHLFGEYVCSVLFGDYDGAFPMDLLCLRWSIWAAVMLFPSVQEPCCPHWIIFTDPNQYSMIL